MKSKSFNPNNSQTTEPPVADLLTLVDSLKQEIATQREELEEKVARLEVQLNKTARPKTPVAPATPGTANTSRRRLIRGLVASAVGVGVLGTRLDPNAAKADIGPNNLFFSGTGANPTNISSGATQIASVPDNTLAQGYPLVSLSNKSTPTNQGTVGNNQSVALYASSDQSFAIYGTVPGSGSAPTAIIGVVGNAATSTDPNSAIYNRYGGVVGTSSTTAGVVGVSSGQSGVIGVSTSTSGVVGISDTGVGGAFASASSDINQGAALQLGVRTSAEGAPNNTYAHNQGEMVMDRYGRLYVSNAGNPAGASVPNPAVPSSRAAVIPNGIINQHGGDWRFLAPMVVRAGNPAASIGTDNQLHVQGELWLDTNAGKIYVCTTTGTSNTQLRTNYNIAGNAVFASLAGGSGVILLPAPDRFIDTRSGANNLNDSRGSFTNPQPRSYTITSLVGRNGSTIPSYATGIIGNITVVGPSGGGFGSVTSNSNPPSTSNVNFNPGTTTAGSFFTALSPSGQIFVTLSVSAGAGQADLIIDIAGYFA